MKALDIHALPLEGIRLIEASAGTGKTWTISALYVRLILDKELSLKVSEILVVTFTKAATMELRDRIRRRLQSVLQSFSTDRAHDDFCSVLQARFVGDEAWVIRKLTRAISNFDDAAIFTIHGFCQRVLNEAAFESGADFELEVLADQSVLEQEIIEDFWRQRIYVASGLWLDYLQSVDASPALWYGMVKRVRGRYQRVCSLPEDIIIEDKEQLFLNLIAEISSLWQIGQQELFEWVGSEQAGLKKPSRDALIRRWPMMDKWVHTGLLSEVVLQSAIQEDIKKELAYFTDEKLAKSVLKGVSYVSQPLFQKISQVVALAELIVPIYANRLNRLYVDLLAYLDDELVVRKASRQQMAFDDMLYRVHQVVVTDSGNTDSGLAAFVRQRYRAAMVDEFQDTDIRQAEIFERIYRAGAAPLFFVGDPKQAIYGFRGADIHAYEAAKAKIPEVACDTLMVNQRSVPRLVEAVNAVFGNGCYEAPFLDKAIEFQPVSAAAPDVFVRLEQSDADYLYGNHSAPFQFLLLPQAVDKEGSPSSRSVSEATRCASEGVAAEIAYLLKQSEQNKALLWGHDRAGVPFQRAIHSGDIAILVSNAWQADEMQRCLNHYGIPSVRQGRESVLISDEARALLAVLSAISRPAKRGWIQTALITELMGLSLSEVVKAAEVPERWDDHLDRFMKWHKLWRDKGFMQMFRAWLNDIGGDGLDVSSRLLAYVDGERKLTNLLHLAEWIQAESRVHIGIEALLARYAKALEASEVEAQNEALLIRLASDAQRVKIVTIHSSKGLEYPIVFCPYLFDVKLPAKQAPAIFHEGHTAYLDIGSDAIQENRLRELQELLEERLRLLYVALTRACYRCYVIWGAVGISDVGADDKKTKGTFHLNALSWLLHLSKENGMSDVDNPNLFSIWQAWCMRYRDHQLILDDLLRVYEHAPDSFGARLLKIQNDDSLLLGTLADHPMQCASFPREALAWGWRVTSFSGLMAYVGHTKLITKTKDDSDVSGSLDEATLSAEGSLMNESEIIASAEPILSVFNYPLREIPASEAGTCVHTILERWFEETPSELDSLVLMEQIICGVMSEVGLSDRWLPVLISMLSHTIYSVMPPLSCALADVPPESRLSEMEFTFPLNAFSAGTFRSVLRHTDYGLPTIFHDAMDQWSFRDISGFMRGYIDLIVEVDEKYFVIDYKTNFLGDSIESYNDSAMSAAIAQHHYYVQYVLYCVAVHRHLRQRVVDYNYNVHFGGVLYLFVRGLGGTGEHGIYFYRPSWDLIFALDQLF